VHKKCIKCVMMHWKGPSHRAAVDGRWVAE
jgi:hypothetical protein